MVVSHFNFVDRILVPIVPVPGQCLLKRLLLFRSINAIFHFDLQLKKYHTIVNQKTSDVYVFQMEIHVPAFKIELSLL